MRRRRARETFSESRRVFIHRLTFFGGGVVLLGGACKCSDPAEPAAAKKRPGIQPQHLTTSHLTFTNEEFATVRALCDRVLPRDQDPGALDADVPVYVDRMLTTPDLRQMKEDFLSGLDALQKRATRTYQKPYAELSAEQQDELLTAFKNSADGSGEAHFYELLVVLTLEGFLGDPSYGGNKDKVGWALVGFQTMPPLPGYDSLKQPHHHEGMH